MEVKEKNPWGKIPPGKKAIPVFTDPKIQRRFLWAIDEEKNHCLLFETKEDKTIIPPKKNLPKLRGLSINEIISKRKFLKITLLDITQLEIFAELCCLLINASVNEESEQGTLSVLLRRCWRWVNLLAGKRDNKLPNSAQKGLIGELYFLSEILINKKNISPEMALESWQGPLGGSKDFDLKENQIEIKAKRTISKPKIKISSEDQLEENPETNLFLAVFGIDFSESKESKDLSEWCLYVEQEIEKRNPNLISQFNNLISEYGFDWEDDYTESKWEIKEIVYYKVTNDFPKIVGSKLSSGIDDVSYSLDMNELKDFEISKEDVLKAI
ncbi:PD-(D/E)XK motif protein [Prochlorococcus marinus XMU1412]|uniref:PD-(D/E)XK motif protein n=1 Tax=Prochlorococcus marinus TaxID=1219 RepID=UPI001ADB01AF|nr:PD-(D/E)XK motif protein [Prochlorococcus marinus]MBO8239486.1 PD-(D/E)XK motif protein [Prochlorococcus marinus XMU1412]MBW3070772.1 hypothetical protein [Prochlorococcus marinus str. MU1412]